MSSHRSARKLVVAVLLGVLVGGGLLAVTPAGAAVSTAAATNWKKIWNKKLKPLAVKSFYTKTQSDAKYQPKGSYETAGSGYSKSETYSRSEIDAKLAPLVNSAAVSAAGDQFESLSSTAETVASVTITPPANGTVVASASGYLWASAAGDLTARCSLTTGATIDSTFLQYVNRPGALLSESETIAATRAFTVTKGSTLTINLVCDETEGSATISDSQLTAIFAPS